MKKIKIEHEWRKFNRHLGIHRWQEMDKPKRKAISIWWGFGLLTIYWK